MTKDTTRKTMKYPMTISKHLNRVCKDIVSGDKYFKGNRNKFFIEAIELAVARRLGAEALKSEWFGVPSEPGESDTPSDNDVVNTRPAPAIEPVPEPEPELPAPKETYTAPEGTPEPEIEPEPAPEPPPEPPKGRPPVLDWIDGGIRNQAGLLYELIYGPPMLPNETKEQQFHRCKTITGVIFAPLTRKGEASELAKKLVIDSAANFQIQE